MTRVAMERWWYYNYIPKDMLAPLKAYRYRCYDTSPFNKLILHPFWNRIVQIIPLWVAPNTLTMMGFICSIIYFLVATYYDYSFNASTIGSSENIPSFAWLMIALFLFLSHHLDGIDGKQARRTNSSSAIGELLDHGCDSWVLTFVALTGYSIVGRDIDGYGFTPIRFYAFVSCWFAYWYLAQWEKLITGVLYLPWVSGKRRNIIIISITQLKYLLFQIF